VRADQASELSLIRRYIEYDVRRQLSSVTVTPAFVISDVIVIGKSLSPKATTLPGSISDLMKGGVITGKVTMPMASVIE